MLLQTETQGDRTYGSQIDSESPSERTGARTGAGEGGMAGTGGPQ